MTENTHKGTETDTRSSIHKAVSIGSFVTGSSSSSKSRNADFNSNHLKETGSQNVSISSKIESIQSSGSQGSGEGSLGKTSMLEQRAKGSAGTGNGADHHQERSYVHPPQYNQYVAPGKPPKQAQMAQSGQPLTYQGIPTYSGVPMGQKAANPMLFNRKFAQSMHSGHPVQQVVPVPANMPQGVNYQQLGNTPYVPRLEKLAPGTVLAVGSHHATIIRFIGQGGFSHIYSVRMDPQEDNSSIACLKRVIVPNKQGLSRLRAEVDVMRRLSKCETTVRYYDSNAAHIPGSTGVYEVLMLMELCENNSLLDYMNQHLSSRLTETEISSILLDVCKAVYELHRSKIIHRDIKIENVLIDKDYRFKLCDFGSACPVIPVPKDVNGFKALQNDLLHQTTPQYRSPEMIDLYRGYPIDEKSDIWALGVFLYKLCYYTTPFEIVGELGILHSAYEMPSTPVYSQEIRHLISLMLQEDPEFRPNIYQVLLQVAEIAHIDPSKLEIDDIYGLGKYREPQNSEDATVVDHMMPFIASRKPIRSCFQRDFDSSRVVKSTNPFITGGNSGINAVENEDGKTSGESDGKTGEKSVGKSERISGGKADGKLVDKADGKADGRNKFGKSSSAKKQLDTLFRTASAEIKHTTATLRSSSSGNLEAFSSRNSSLSMASGRSSVSSQASSILPNSASTHANDIQHTSPNPFRKAQSEQSTDQRSLPSRDLSQEQSQKQVQHAKTVPFVKVTGAKSEIQAGHKFSPSADPDGSLADSASIDAQNTSTSTDSLVDNVEERFPDILRESNGPTATEKRWSTHNPFPNISSEHLEDGAVQKTDISRTEIPEQEEASTLVDGVDLIDLANRGETFERKKEEARMPKKATSMNPFDL